MAPAAAAATEQAGAGHGVSNGAAEWRVAVPAAAAAGAADQTDDDVVAGEHENVRGGRRRRRACCSPPARFLFSWMAACVDRVAGFGRMVWRIGKEDPRKVVHGLKMALALTLCSVFYYVRPLYVFTGETAMWAVLTVVVVFEYTVGACLYKGLNRAMATVIGGALALGVHWIASKSGKEFEPFILGGSLFLMAAMATFSRFIPTMKARFDYGVTIFILTYCLVAVSGYRVDALAAMAQQRLTTIAIGALICFAVCALFCPVWAGQELHLLVARNMEKLAAAVEGCVDDHFSDDLSSAVEDAAAGSEKTAARRRPLSEKALGYKFVLNAKASEDSLANLARWEPGHGEFGFRHPYGQYQKVGAAMRCCAYSVDALAACVAAEAQAPVRVKKHLAAACTALSRHCAAALREASGSVTSMTRSGRLALAVAEMNDAAQDLRDELRCLATILDDEDEGEEQSDAEDKQSIATLPPATTPTSTLSLIEALPLFTAASLLLETCARAEAIAGAVESLATAARFKRADGEEKAALDVEAAVLPITATATSSPLVVGDAPQETTHGKDVAGDQEKTETAVHADAGSSHEPPPPRDQVGELIKVLMRRRSSKNKWARRDTKVSPRPPPDFVGHAPSLMSRSAELAGHAAVALSPSHRSMDLASHGPVLPSPRNRSVDFARHGPALPSPRNRSMDFGNHGPVLPSPRNRSMDFASGPILASPRNRSILGMA